MKYLSVLLLTALLANNVFAIPMPRALSYVRRNENATILDLIAQYKQYKLQVIQAEHLKAKLLEQAKSKQLAIERKIGITSNSTSSRGAAKSTFSGAVEPFTVLTATGFAVVFAYHGATSTVSLNLMTTNPPAPASTSTTSSFAVPYTVLTAIGPVVVFASQETTRTVTLNSTATSPQAPTRAPSITEPVTVLTVTGSVVILASQGTTRTVMLNATSTGPSPSTTSDATSTTKP